MANPIPEALRALDQWVTWRYERDTKVPYSPQTGRRASSTKPETWASYAVTVTAQESRGHSGIGFVFSVFDPFTGVDLDDCIDESGAIADWARQIVASLDSYTEVSPSGRGLKVWVEGTVPTSVKTQQIEIYSERRYFTVTGQHLPDTPLTIRAAQAELTAL